MDINFIGLILASIMASAVPLILASCGELITERSGVLNLGVEGMMIIGAISGFALMTVTGNLFVAIIGRGLVIAANAPTLFTRLLAGAITLIFFTYVFVNIGMVSGILPVVGVPLPLISYGGTSLVTILFGIGILMSIQTHRRLVQT